MHKSVSRDELLHAIQDYADEWKADRNIISSETSMKLFVSPAMKALHTALDLYEAAIGEGILDTLMVKRGIVSRGLPGVGEVVETNQALDLAAPPNWQRDEVAEGFGRGVPELCGFVTKNRWNCHWSEEGKRWRRVLTTGSSQ